MSKVTFSGHESFICKQFWLKKIYDFSSQHLRFNDDNAVVDLGVGKNMVASLRYWGKAFGILNDDDTPSDLATFLFEEDGADPYLEDLGTVWLLHYQLAKTNRASIYNLFFNEFRKERIDFTKDHLHSFLKRRCEELYPSAYNVNTIGTDINVFLRSYLKPHKDDKLEIEDDFTGILIDLDLIKHYKQKVDDRIVNWYKIESHEGENVPFHIILYVILDTYRNQKSISFHELHSGKNSPGSIFALSQDGLYNKLLEISQNYRQAVYTETAGNQVLQFKANIQPQTILNDYYQG